MHGNWLLLVEGSVEKPIDAINIALPHVRNNKSASRSRQRICTSMSSSPNINDLGEKPSARFCQSDGFEDNVVKVESDQDEITDLGDRTDGKSASGMSPQPLQPSSPSLSSSPSLGLCGTTSQAAEKKTV